MRIGCVRNKSTVVDSSSLLVLRVPPRKKLLSVVNDSKDECTNL